MMYEDEIKSRVKKARSKIWDLEIMKHNCDDKLLKIVDVHLSTLDDVLRKDTRSQFGEDLWNMLYGSSKYSSALWVSKWTYSAKIERPMDYAEPIIIYEFMLVLVGKRYNIS